VAFESDHLLLRRYAAARESGDLEAAAELWKRLAVNNFDRVQQIVRAFSFSPGGPRLPEDEHGSAATEAYLRVIAMGANFEKRETGSFYAALVTCVQHSCMDYGRKQLRHEKRAAGSLDATFDGNGEATPYDGAFADYHAQLQAQTRDAVEGEINRLEAEQLVAWGIAQMTNAKHREILELTYTHKLSAEDIADQLGISLDNVYTRRYRGGRELEKILRGPRS